MNHADEAAFETVIEAHLLQHGYECVPADAGGSAAKRKRNDMREYRQAPDASQFLIPGACGVEGWVRMLEAELAP